MKTRECITKGSFWFAELEAAGEGALALALVSDIFDEIESRVCENCDRWRNDELGKWCWLSSEEMFEKDFCSKFERKTK